MRIGDLYHLSFPNGQPVLAEKRRRKSREATLDMFGGR